MVCQGSELAHLRPPKVCQYGHKKTVLFQWMRVMIVRWQNTKQNILPVCDKLYYTNKRILQKWEGVKHLQNYALSGRGLFYQTKCSSWMCHLESQYAIELRPPDGFTLSQSSTKIRHATFYFRLQFREGLFCLILYSLQRS